MSQSPKAICGQTLSATLPSLSSILGTLYPGPVESLAGAPCAKLQPLPSLQNASQSVAFNNWFMGTPPWGPLPLMTSLSPPCVYHHHKPYYTSLHLSDYKSIFSDGL